MPARRRARCAPAAAERSAPRAAGRLVGWAARRAGVRRRRAGSSLGVARRTRRSRRAVVLDQAEVDRRSCASRRPCLSLLRCRRCSGRWPVGRYPTWRPATEDCRADTHVCRAGRDRPPRGRRSSRAESQVAPGASAAQPRGDRGQPGERRARVLAERRDRHHARAAAAAAAGDRARPAAASARPGRAARASGASPSRHTCTQHVDARPARRRPRSSAATSWARSTDVDDVGVARHAARLVGLQPPDEVPAQRGPRHSARLSRRASWSRFSPTSVHAEVGAAAARRSPGRSW